MNNISVFYLELTGDNSDHIMVGSFEFTPMEDWLTGKVSYNIELRSVRIIRSKKEREILPFLTIDQQKKIISEINRKSIEDHEEDKLNSFLNNRTESVA